jgi:hypothetical protein
MLADLGQRGLLHFPLESAKFAQDYFKGASADSGSSSSTAPPIGNFEQLTLTDSARLRATGWALWPATAKRADAIVIAALLPDKRSLIVGVSGETFLSRADVSAKDHLPVSRCGWSASFGAAHFPGGIISPGITLEAYVYDASTRTLWLIPGSHPAP